MEWQDLDVNNLPSDILVDGAWEIEPTTEKTSWDESDNIYDMLQNASDRTRNYRIRRPEGWEPKECPTCGLCDKLFHDYRELRRPHYMDLKWKIAPKTWHNEAPTHEEIMTPRYWEARPGIWVAILSYDESNGLPYHYRHNETDYYARADWFINRQSADIPPVATE